jgi:hypothetical protein
MASPASVNGTFVTTLGLRSPFGDRRYMSGSTFRTPKVQILHLGAGEFLAKRTPAQ